MNEEVWPMTKAQLIRRLSDVDDDIEIMILDGFNGAGNPREINFGPTPVQITEEDAEATADCEGLVGEAVFVLGYGCY
jgi:hypothetical protein